MSRTCPSGLRNGNLLRDLLGGLAREADHQDAILHRRLDILGLKSTESVNQSEERQRP